MDKISSIKLNRVKNIPQTAFTGENLYSSFKMTTPASTAVIPQKDTFVPTKTSKETNLKNLFNAVPDSYADELFVGGLALAAIAYKMIKGKPPVNPDDVKEIVGKAISAIGQKVDDLSGKFSNVDNSLSKLTDESNKLANQASELTNKTNEAINKANGALELANTRATGKTILTENVEVNNHAIHVDLATNLRGYGHKTAELEKSLQTEATKRIFGMLPKKVATGNDVTIRIPTAEFEQIAKTGGLAVVPPEMMSNIAVLAHGKQNVNFVLDMPLYLGPVKNNSKLSLKINDNGLYDVVDELAAKKDKATILHNLTKIADMDIPIKTDIAETTEKLTVFLQRDRKFKVDYELAKNFIPRQQKNEIAKAIKIAKEQNAPQTLTFGKMQHEITPDGNVKSFMLHDALFYHNRKFDLSGPTTDRARDIYSNASEVAETERFIYFDKFFYEFLTRQEEVLSKPFGVDAIIGNDWHTGGISAMMRLMPKVQEATGQLTPQKAEQLYNTPIITLMHNATLGGGISHISGELGDMRAKLANIMFGEHAAFITKNAHMPSNAGTLNGIFKNNYFNPQTLAATYSDTVVPVSKNYGREMAEEALLGGENREIFALRQSAVGQNSSWKNGKLGITENKEYANLVYDPITNGLDKTGQILNQSTIASQFETGLKIPTGTIKPFTTSRMNLMEWHDNSKKVLLQKLADNIKINKFH